MSTKKQINFYTSDWKPVTSAAHQFDELSAITFDETEEIIYFNDQQHNNGTIFSLKLSADDNHRVERIVQKTENEFVQGIAFDPLERMLYWTDSGNKVIYQMDIDHKTQPTILYTLSDDKIPHGIAIDICRRKLYWTNANHRAPSIERISLDGSKYEVLITADLFMPKGIVVDQFSKRIFWVDDLEGNHYSVESANLDGTDRRNITRKLYNVPFNLATDKTSVYWTDLQQDAVWSISKDAIDDDEPIRVQNFTNHPKGIVIRNHFLSTQTKNIECKTVLNLIKTAILTPSPSNLSMTSPRTTDTTTIAIPNQLCLNNGYVNPKTNQCICQHEYQGIHCEIPICHNYCIEGTCHISSTGYPQCECKPGFTGERCENDLCNGYCLNGGRCTIENNEPNCRCTPSYYGRHCEIMDKLEMCTRFCNNEVIESKNLDLDTICNR